MGTQIEFTSPRRWTVRHHALALLIGLFLVLGSLTSVAVLPQQGSDSLSDFEQIA